MEKYDAVIIGAGIGGLLCAALLSRKGYRVAVFEKEKYPGGYCSSFKIDGWTFDTAVDSIGGLRQGHPLRNILRTLRVEDRLDFIELQPVRRNIFPDFCIDIPADVPAYKENLKVLFPPEGEGLDKVFSLMEEVYEQSILSSLGDKSGARFRLQRWIGKSFQAFLDSYLAEQRLKAMLSSYCTFLGLPASEVSALAAINTLMHYVQGGAFRIRGGMQKLADVLMESIRSNAGEVILGEKVVKVLIEKHKATGVGTENQRYVAGNYIISNMDLKTLVNSMVEEDVIDKNRLAELNELEVSGSFVIVYLGMDMNFSPDNLTGSVGYFSSYKTDSMLNRGENVSLGLSIPSVLDDSLAPKGCHNLIIHWPLGEYNKSTNKNEISDRAIEQAEHLIPDLSHHILLRRVADASTFYRYTGNYQGAAYGWKQKAGFYAHRPLFRNILDNFYLVGHWAGLGGGIMPSAISSLKAVEEITKEK